jgi:hypothetical protein
MTEAEILQFNDEIRALLERVDPDESPAKERVLSAILLAQAIANAAGGELTREEFLQDCADGWDVHWKLFNEIRNRKAAI